jgi:hypothetical protein
MRLHSLRDVGTEAQIVLRTLITPREMYQVDGADNVSMTAMIEKAHQKGTLSVSTMYRRFFMPRGTRLIKKPSRFRALASALSLELYEPWNMKAYPSPAGFFFRFMASPRTTANPRRIAPLSCVYS